MVVLAFADSFLNDMKLFRSLHIWCEAPESATQVVLTAVSAVSAIVVRWSDSQKESSASMLPIVAIAASASFFFEFGPFPLPFHFPRCTSASSPRIQNLQSTLTCPFTPVITGPIIVLLSIAASTSSSALTPTPATMATATATATATARPRGI